MQLEIGLSAADSPHNGFLCWLVPQGAHAVTIDPGPHRFDSFDYDGDRALNHEELTQAVLAFWDVSAVPPQEPVVTGSLLDVSLRPVQGDLEALFGHCQMQIRKGPPEGEAPFKFKKKRASMKKKPEGRPRRPDATGAVPLLSLAEIMGAFFEMELPELDPFSDYADVHQEACVHVPLCGTQ